MYVGVRVDTHALPHSHDTRSYRLTPGICFMDTDDLPVDTHGDDYGERIQEGRNQNKNIQYPTLNLHADFV